MATRKRCLSVNRPASDGMRANSECGLRLSLRRPFVCSTRQHVLYRVSAYRSLRACKQHMVAEGLSLCHHFRCAWRTSSDVLTQRQAILTDEEPPMSLLSHHSMHTEMQGHPDACQLQA